MNTEMARVVVIGTSCVGKTRFAQSLAHVLSFPHIELDAFYWQPQWVPRLPDHFRALVAQALSEERWVTDGNYGEVRDIVWSRATTVIWLDYAFPLVFWRALSRTVRRVITREELFANNRESLRLAFFSRDSILWWVLTTFRRRRRQYQRLFDAPTFPHLSYVQFRKPSEAERFLTILNKQRQHTNLADDARGTIS
jgi:adenylate kinase family enzyme